MEHMSNIFFEVSPKERLKVNYAVLQDNLRKQLNLKTSYTVYPSSIEEERERWSMHAENRIECEKSSTSYLECLAKFIRHEIIENRIYACGDVIKNSRDVSRIRKDGPQPIAILILVVSHINVDESLNEREEKNKKMEKLTVIFLYYPHNILNVSLRHQQIPHTSAEFGIMVCTPMLKAFAALLVGLSYVALLQDIYRTKFLGYGKLCV